MKSILLLMSVGFFSCAVIPQVSQPTSAASSTPPRLIIGITVDQMKYDFLEKYRSDFGSGGFNRLVSEGFSARNLHYNYMPTYTGPGHASIFTGTTPVNHGIIANDWYDREKNALVYCAADPNVLGVGTTAAEGQRSPMQLKSSTIGDELELFFNERSKVIGIAMKDRGGILPAGRTADAAYWFIGAQEGKWVSSTWYMNALPRWVDDFNQRGLPDTYLHRGWPLLRPESVYDESMADNNPHEAPFKGTTRPVFPYNLDSLRSQNLNYDLIKATPWGNTHTVDFAIATIEGESLGTDEHTDMLCMSFSSTDYVGHQFGIHSRELQDCYLRLDLEIERFINYLDSTIGRNQYLIFLSADHGGAPTPSYTMKQHAAAGYWTTDSLVSAINKRFTDLNYAVRVKNYSNDQVFFDSDTLYKFGYNHPFVQEEAARVAREFEGVHSVYCRNELEKGLQREGMASLVQAGFHQQRSGDVVIVTDPGWIKYSMQGTTHGSPWVYDTHVPALFFGYGIRPGETIRRYEITDIAPTISHLCRFPLPNACTGEPIEEVFTH
ncbi:MAG: alkaline phosphatase family protein [Flavobacteriales bacterium]|nr:alkaline phosphatase family protein [Flavobacteriales bacterium]